MTPDDELQAAIKQGDSAKASAALAAGANASSRNSVGLANAIQNMDAYIIALLIQHGASVRDAQEVLSMTRDHDVPINFRDTDIGCDSHVGMAIACMKAGMWPIEEIVNHCNTLTRLALIMWYHPDAASLLPLLPEASRVSATDFLMEGP